MINKEDLCIDDFYVFQQPEIEELLRNEILVIKNSFIKPNILVCYLLGDLYFNDVVCYQYWEKTEVIDRLIEEGKLSINSSLFSRDESDYINFMFNQSEFSNGFDIRNKYTHDTCPTDEKKQQKDYFEILKIMILMIIKINEEFCLLHSDD
ncbi:MAG: hypothetical protein K5879_03265 [Lachnospiraceae bacterium]|nr:hypothetical protein [Lachnospiraceae bacterium]